MMIASREFSISKFPGGARAISTCIGPGAMLFAIGLPL
jgi:hypothetical protein